MFDSIDYLNRRAICENYIRSGLATSNFATAHKDEHTFDRTAFDSISDDADKLFADKNTSLINPAQNLVDAILTYLFKDDKKSQKETIYILANLSKLEQNLLRFNNLFNEDCIERIFNDLITYLVNFFY